MQTSPLTGSPETTFVRHLPCSVCGSSDANSLYSDGNMFCFKCHTYTSGDQSNVVHSHHVKTIQLTGQALDLKKRNISAKTCEKFKAYTDGDLLKFYYYNKEGQLLGAKTKTKQKEFRYEGETDGGLYGMHLFKAGGKRVVVVEGEMDALAVYEAQPGWAVCSIQNGAASAKKAIQKNFEWLCKFEKVVLFFDNDQAGKQAATEAASVLPPGKAYIGFLENYKDASDALIANDTEAIRGVCNYNHEQYRPDGIVDAKQLLDLVCTPTPPSDHDYPFQGLQAKLHGIRLGELTTITAGSGIGKSTFLRQLCAGLLDKGERCGFLALEESNRRTALGLMSVAAEKPLHMGEYERPFLVDLFDKTMGTWDLHLYDGFGSYDPNIIYERIEYMASALETRVVFLDHLSILLSGLDGDERRMIDQTMTRLRSLTERTGISLFLVCHTTTPPNGQSHEEGGRVQLRSLRGSRSIGQLSDSVIALERDQQSGSERDATTVRVLKNRYSGEVGEACQLKYDLDKCKFYEIESTTDFDPAADF